MRAVDRIKLSEVFKSVAKPRFVLGTSYTLSLAFFESVLLPHIDRANLAACLLICDAFGYDGALAEGGAIQGAGQEYQVMPAPVHDCFHPKVWVVVGSEATVVLVGSGNLTQAGFVSNLEVFDAVRIAPDSPVSAQFVESLVEFVSGLEQMWPKGDARQLLCVETLAHIADECRMLPTAKTIPEANEVDFIHSFRGPMIGQLPVSGEAKNLYAASPFFGGSIEGIGLLAARYPKAKLSIFPAIHSGTAIDVPIDLLSKSYEGVKVAPLQFAEDDGSAFAHLKLYGIEASDNAWLCTTSANCTKAAWQGHNVEAGIVRPVSTKVLPTYFIADDTPLPSESISYNPLGSSTSTLKFWASEVGDKLEITISQESQALLPLSIVTVTVRCGSSFETCIRPLLFQDKTSVQLDRSTFPEWHRRRNTAVCLEVSGQSPKNGIVRGRCFVENRILLTADPIHRSAWRGALVLLEEEGAPELVDIAAIFTLAQAAFDGPMVQLVGPISTNQANAAAPEAPAPDSIAVWPPQPDIKELYRRIGNTAAGRLQLFQRIFQTFLQNEAAEAAVTSDSGTADREGAEDDDSKEEARKAEEKKRIEGNLSRIWIQAEANYQQVVDRLMKLVPTKEKANNVWPAAIFCFLSTLAVFRAAKRLAPDRDWKVTSSVLCDEFMRVMFNERKQHPDFCCPRGFRYKSEKFPPMADDLKQVFGATPHRDLALVVLTILVDQRLRLDPPMPLVLIERRVSQTFAAEFKIDEAAVDTCRRIWRRYVRSEESKVTDDEFTAAVIKFPIIGMHSAA